MAPVHRAARRGGTALLLVAAVLSIPVAVASPLAAGLAALLLAAGAAALATARGDRVAAAPALAALAVGGAVCAITWPVVAVAIALVLVLLAAALRWPAPAFVGGLLVVAAEGTFKARLTTEGVPSATELGAILIDLVLVVTVVGLVVANRGRSLRAVWAGGGRAERLLWALIGVWLVASVAQIAMSPRIVDALQGVRLTQGYVLVAAAGIAFLSSGKQDELRGMRWLLGAFAAVAGYAALRAVVDGPAWEQGYALARSTHVRFGSDFFRDVGSFGSVFALAGFLVPVAVFSLVIGYLQPRVRVLAWLTFVMATVGIVASYVRIAIVALGVGALAAALLLSVGRDVPAKVKATMVVLALATGGAAYVAAVSAGGVSEVTSERARGLQDPLADESLRERWSTWRDSFEKTLDSPMGTGVGTVGHATAVDDEEIYTDNSYLKLLQEQGLLVGAMFLIGVVGTTVAAGRRLARRGPIREPVAVAAWAAFVAFLVLCMLGEYVELPGKAIAWTMLGIALWGAYGRRAAPASGT